MVSKASIIMRVFLFVFLCVSVCGCWLSAGGLLTMLWRGCSVNSGFGRYVEGMGPEDSDALLAYE
eukprot:SAG25_NODE_2712_length_1428_cov_0.963883_2_plen_65_part_00